MYDGHRVWGVGAGYAAAMPVVAFHRPVQAVVGVLWGLLRFKELKGPEPQQAAGVKGVS